MKLGELRKLYSQIPKEAKNIKWRKITDAELTRSMCEPQVIANCYDEATRYALLNSKKGRKMLADRIWIERGNSTTPAYKFRLNIDGKDEVYRSTYHDYSGAFSKITEAYYMATNNFRARLSLGINIAIDKMICKNPKMKPFLSKLNITKYPCEYNKPSNAFKWFTGKTPQVIGEDTFTFNLKPFQDDVSKLLDNLSKKQPEEYSFVAMTGPFPARIKNPITQQKQKIASWHCCSVTDVSKEKDVTIRNPRTKELIKVPFKEFIEKFKGIIGLEH